jgi:Tol biopolymer transport system component
VAAWTRRCYDGLLGSCARSRYSLWVIGTSGGAAQAVARTDRGGYAAPVFSPDGQRLAFLASRRERTAVHVEPVPPVN